MTSKEVSYIHSAGTILAQLEKMYENGNIDKMLVVTLDKNGSYTVMASNDLPVETFNLILDRAKFDLLYALFEIEQNEQ